MNKKIMAIALVLIVVGIVGMAITANKFTLSEPERVIDVQVFPSDEVEVIHIESGVASLNIEPGEKDEVQVVREGQKESSGNHDITMELRGDELHIQLERKKIFGLFRFDFFFNFSKKKDHLNIYLPEKQFQLLFVKNNLGSTKINSLHADSVEIHSDVANITLEDIVAQQLSVTTSIGDVNLKEINAMVKVISEIGDIDVNANEIYEDMILESNIGDITVKLPRIPENISFYGESDIGSLNIFGSKNNLISDNPNYSVSIETEIGDIDVIIDP